MKSYKRPNQKEEDENWEKSTSGSNKSAWYADMEEPIGSIKLTNSDFLPHRGENP
jgi:hypothetical protein